MPGFKPETPKVYVQEKPKPKKLGHRRYDSASKAALELWETVVIAIDNSPPAVVVSKTTSNNMLFSKTLVKGYVMKKVENIKMGRLQNPYHKRKLTLNLQCNPAPSLVMESVDS